MLWLLSCMYSKLSHWLMKSVCMQNSRIRVCLFVCLFKFDSDHDCPYRQINKQTWTDRNGKTVCLWDNVHSCITWWLSSAPCCWFNSNCTTSVLLYNMRTYECQLSYMHFTLQHADFCLNCVVTMTQAQCCALDQSVWDWCRVQVDKGTT